MENLKPVRVSNKAMGACVENRKPFRNHNGTVYAEYRELHDGKACYVVYSYGEHFPMYIYDYGLRRWFGNADKYSPTTSCHQNYCRPSYADVVYVDTDTMHELLRGDRSNIGNQLLHGMAKGAA